MLPIFQIIQIVYCFYLSLLGILLSYLGSSPCTSLLDRVESKAIRLNGDPSLTSTQPSVSSPQGGFFYLFSTAITLVTALMNGGLYSTSSG